MRQIVLDTETTGLKPEEGHRVIEIGCIELIDRQLTGGYFHHYVNPEREIESGAFAVHGIDNAMLANKPLFRDILDDLLAFITGAELIIHNAPFDVGFLDSEFDKSGKKLKKITKYCQVIDTLTLARQMHPGQRNSLDALCKRYHIDNSHREYHGALLDAEILARVYLAMTGGQTSLFGVRAESNNQQEQQEAMIKENINRESLLIISASEIELQRHTEYLEELRKLTQGQCVWDEV